MCDLDLMTASAHKLQYRGLLYERRVAPGAYDVRLPADAVRRLLAAAAAQRWPRLEAAKFRRFTSDGMAYETDGREAHRVTAEAPCGEAVDDDEARVLTLPWRVQKLPFHAFPRNLEAVRHVADVFRVSFQCAKGVVLCLDLVQDVDRSGRGCVEHADKTYCCGELRLKHPPGQGSKADSVAWAACVELARGTA